MKTVSASTITKPRPEWKPSSVRRPSTTHLSIVDGAGNAVALTSSIEDAFGNRRMAGGFLLNNQLTDFSTDGANRLEPGKRPRSSMAPTFVFDQRGQLQAVLIRGAPPLGWWAGACLAVAGVVMMVAGPGAAQAPSPLGLGLCLLAGLSYAVYALVNKHMVAQAPAGVLTAAVFALAAVLALPMAWLLGGPLVTGSAASWAVVVWLGVMSTAVAYLLFTHALQHISSATGVALALGEPVTAFVLAVLVVGERPGWLAFAGLVLVLAGLAVVVRAELRQTTEQAPA